MKNENSVIKLFNERLGMNLTTMSELEENLSQRFQKAIDNQEDAQQAYEEVNDSTNGLLGQHFCYSLSKEGEVWSVEKGDEYSSSDFDMYLERINEYYGSNLNNIDDILSKLESQVRKTMSNAACDMFTALNMILEEDLDLEGVFVIQNADAEPRILYVAS